MTDKEEVASVKKLIDEIKSSPEKQVRAEKAKEMFEYILTTKTLLTPKNIIFVRVLKDKANEFIADPTGLKELIGPVLYTVLEKVNDIITAYDAGIITPAPQKTVTEKEIHNFIILGDAPGVQKYIDENPDDIDKPLLTDYKISYGGKATLLGAVSYYGNEKIVNMLLAAGAKVQQKTNVSYPLDYAIKGMRENIIKILIGAGAEVKTSADILLVPVDNYNVGIIKTLFDAGLNIKGMNNDAILDKLLHLYYRNRRTENGKKMLEIIKLFVAAGLNKSACAADGTLALLYIRNKGLTELEEVFAGFDDYVDDLLPLDVPDIDIPDARDASDVPFSTFGIIRNVDIPILTIPKGTLLYNCYTVEDSANKLKNTLNLMAGILPFNTTVEPSGNTINIKGCIDKLQQKFFYSTPAGGPALGSVTGAIFNTMGVFETKREMRFALLMTPSDFHRLSGKENPSKIPCSKLEKSDCKCGVTGTIGISRGGGYNSNDSNYSNYYSNDNNNYNYSRHKSNCKYGHSYDVCIKSEYLKEHNLDGHIAIAKDDSYNTRMKHFDDRFRTSLDYNIEYRKLNRILFDGGVSKDIRPPDAENPTTLAIDGFPELVIHMFQTDWYDKKDTIIFNHSIPVPTTSANGISTEDEQVEALTNFLLDVNNGDDMGLEFESPMRLIALSTSEKWRNIQSGYTFDKIYSGKKGTINNFYINVLEAYIRGDIRFYFDARTGFLVWEGSAAPRIYWKDDLSDVQTFMEVSTSYSNGVIGKTVLEKSYMTRKNLHGEDTDLYAWPQHWALVPFSYEDMPVRGGVIEKRRKIVKRTLIKPINRYMPITHKKDIAKKGLISWNTKKRALGKKMNSKKITVKRETNSKRNTMKKNRVRNVLISTITDMMADMKMEDDSKKKHKDVYNREDMSDFVLPAELEGLADTIMRHVRRKLGV